MASLALTSNPCFLQSTPPPCTFTSRPIAGEIGYKLLPKPAGLTYSRQFSTKFPDQLFSQFTRHTVHCLSRQDLGAEARRPLRDHGQGSLPGQIATATDLCHTPSCHRPTPAIAPRVVPSASDKSILAPRSQDQGGPPAGSEPEDDWPWDWTHGTSSQVAFALMLASIPVVPLIPRFQWSASIYFGVIALWAVYVGSHRSLKTKQTQRISLKQSFAVPILCSCTLFGFYCLLRFFPDLDLRTFFTFYLNFVGALAVGSNLSDPLRAAFPQINDKWSTQIDIPEWLLTAEDQPVHVTLAPSDIFATLAGLLLAVGSQLAGAPFTLSNFVAVCIVSELLQLISLGSFPTAAVMLSGLLIYDVFWVFGSSSVFGDNVMLTVATSDTFSGPMKLVFPNWNPNATSPSILGLGDVAAPGLLMALMLRFDRSRWRRQQTTPGAPDGMLPSADWTTNDGAPAGALPPADKSYFVAAVASYVVGLAITIGFNAFTGAAQPALLYLVPSLLGGILFAALARSELGLLWRYKDEALIVSSDPLPIASDPKDRPEL